jgi:hypothetical protein
MEKLRKTYAMAWDFDLPGPAGARRHTKGAAARHL